MLKSDLVEILSAFTPLQQKRLRDFFNSPYGNPYYPAPAALRLTEYIFKALESENSEDLHREQLYEKVFPGEPPIFNKLEKQASTALKTARKFAQLETLEKLRSEPFDHYLLAAFYQEKAMQAPFEHVYAKLKSWKDQKKQWGHWEYCVNWLLEETHRAYQTEFFQKKDCSYLLHSLQALEDLYLSERFFYTTTILEFNRITPSIPIDHQHRLLDALQYPQDAPYRSTAVGQLFQQANYLITTQNADIEKVSAFIHLLHHEVAALNPVHFNHLEVYAINYCVHHNAKDPRYLPLLYGLLKQRVESERSFYQGRIAASEFQNIVKTGLVCRDFEWVRAFIEENRDKITGSDNPEELYRYNLANYLFYTKDYDQALKILLIADYDELTYKISAKILEIKILYETESDVLPARIDAAKIFFYREKSLNEQRKAQYCGFADFMRRLIRPQTAVSPQRLLKLKEELETPPTIAEKYWVAEKLEALLLPKKQATPPPIQ